MQIEQIQVPVCLCTVKSFLEKIPYHPGYSLTMQWFVEDRLELPVPIEQAIWRYDPEDQYAKVAKEALKGCFTPDEARSLRRYLNIDEGNNYATEVINVKLPISLTRAAILFYSRNRKNSKIGHYCLYETSDYNLNFKVSGYYVIAPI